MIPVFNWHNLAKIINFVCLSRRAQWFYAFTVIENVADAIMATNATLPAIQGCSQMLNAQRG